MPDFPENKGYQKIGYTERKNVDDRILEQVKTAAKKLNYKKLWSASAFYAGTKKSFKDKALHQYYIEQGIHQNKKKLGQEWFEFKVEGQSKALFDEFVKRKPFNQMARKAKLPYKLRKEQDRAVSQTLRYASNHQTTDFSAPNKDAKFLWNAKPRFGKTLSAYDFAKRFNAKNVLIVTNRPAIANSWFKDYENFVDKFYFISKTDSLKNYKTMSIEEYLDRDNPSSDDKQITFVSLQDLKDSRSFGGNRDKLEWAADINWDLLIVDESHEGVDTEKTNTAFNNIKRRFTLYLSGTPFKALADGQFTEDQIFNWTYLDEQKAKLEEIDEGDDSGDHVNLPDMRLFTYKISDMISKQLESGMDISGENIDYAFDLNEMFSTDKNGKFIHEDDISIFLDNLTSNTKYPFSTPELRSQLKHTFWLVGNRVSSAKAMEKLLRKHRIFGEYKIIIAAGDGKLQSDYNDEYSFEKEMQDVSENKKAFDRVKKAIHENEKTITLSVGQLTTGVTIEEWSAVLMLSDIKSESLYMQAIFRAQNPYEFIGDNGDIYRKKSAYVFDFSPNRVLSVYDKFANDLLSEAVQGEVTEKIRKNNVAELLNYFPVLAEDNSGKMIELDAEKVLAFPKAIIAKEVVDRRFVTNLLFVNINNVFNIPSEVISALNRASSTSDIGKQIKNEEVHHDPDRQVERDRRISVNKDKILGKKIYRLFLQGYSPFGIAKELTGEGILTPGGKKKWSARTVAAILSNEKYKGDALLQKSFTVDFLTKEKKKNEGEIPQYYVTGNHEAIIPPSTFDRVQRLLEQRKAGKNRISSVSIYSSKIICGDCGSWYGSKTWHSTSKYRQKIWQCNHKFEEKCATAHLTEEEIQKLFLEAVNKLVKNKKEIISNHKEMANIIFDTSTLEEEKLELEEELNFVAEQVNECINENARKVQNQDEYEIRYSSLVNRFNATKVRLDETKQTIIEKQSKRDEVQDFIKELEKQELMTEFDKNVWLSMVDYLTVHHDGKVEFTFLDGNKVELNR